MSNDKYDIFEYMQKILDINVKPSITKKIEDNICRFLIFTGNTNPYYKYFLSKSDDAKDNLIMLYEDIRTKRFKLATLIFFSYNIIKSILWRYGYFAYFFYNTRLMSLFFYIITLKLISNDFKVCLKNDNLLRYYHKRIKTIDLDKLIRQEQIKSLMISEKFDEINKLL